MAPQQHRAKSVPRTMSAVLVALASGSFFVGTAVGCVAVFVGCPVLKDGSGVTCVLVFWLLLLVYASVLPLFGSFGVYGFEFWLVGSFLVSSVLVVVVDPELVLLFVLLLVLV